MGRGDVSDLENNPHPGLPPFQKAEMEEGDSDGFETGEFKSYGKSNRVMFRAADRHNFRLLHPQTRIIRACLRWLTEGVEATTIPPL